MPPGISDKSQKLRKTHEPARLTKTQYDYLASGILKGAYKKRPDKLEKQIQKKLDQLPARIELLIDDVKILDQNDYLESTTWKNGWQDLLNIRESNDIDTEFEFDPRFREASQAAKFGERIGQLAYRLMLTPPGKSESDILTDLIDGLIEGVCFSRYHQTHTDTEAFRKQLIETLMDEVISRHIQRAEIFEQYYQEELDEREEHLEKFEEKKEEIREILRKHDYINTEDQYNHGLPGNSIDHVLNTLYWELYPEKGWTPSKLQEPVDEQQLLGIIDEKHLAELEQLRELVTEDTARLKNKSGRGPEPIAIFREIFANGHMSSGELADQLDAYTASITETVRDLAGDRNPTASDRDIWSERPLVESTPQGWHTTTYGDAVGHMAFDPELYEFSLFLPQTLFDTLRKELELR